MDYNNIKEALIQNSITELIYDKEIKHDDLQELCELIKDNTSLITLRLNRCFNHIFADLSAKQLTNRKSVTACENIFNILLTNTTLKNLDVSNNAIGQNYGDYECIANALKHNSTLVKLTIDDNSLGFKNDKNFNAGQIFDALKYNRSLRELSLHNTLILYNDSIFEHIGDMLRNNTTLTHLDMDYTRCKMLRHRYYVNTVGNNKNHQCNMYPCNQCLLFASTTFFAPALEDNYAITYFSYDRYFPHSVNEINNYFCERNAHNKKLKEALLYDL
jgi:hypothetical protein